MKVRLIYGLVFFILVFSVERYMDYKSHHELYTNIEIVNIAGKQRMYSQKITKLALYANQNSFKLPITHKILEDTYHQFSMTHNILSQKTKNDKSNDYLSELYTKIEPFYQQLIINTILLIEGTRVNNDSNASDIKKIKSAIENIKVNESQFLNLMDKIVNEYEKNGRETIDRAVKRENTFNVIFICIFIYIIFFVLLPSKNKKGGNVFNF
jgi:hypothetical protein